MRWFLGGGLAMVGLGLLLMSGLKAGDDWTALLAGFMVAGAGIGLVNPALATAAIGVVEPRRAGMASGINSTFRQVGIATGIAALGALFQHDVATKFRGAVASAGGTPPPGLSPSAVADFVSFGGAQKVGNAALARAGETAFVGALDNILLYASLLAFAGALLARALTRDRDFVGGAVPVPA